MRKAIILYERKNREFENCLILKKGLEDAGYKVVISHFLNPVHFNWFQNKSYKYMFVPHLYNDDSCYRNLHRFGKAEYVVNLQYEQVLSVKWEQLGHHNPKGLALDAVHICWGKLTQERLHKAGVPLENCPVLGTLQLDLLRDEFRDSHHVTKNKMAKQFKLNEQKPWVLFLSSFTYADISSQRLKINEDVAGIPLHDIVPFYTDSRNLLIDWFDEYLKVNQDCLFIYRPHPDELNLDIVKKLKNRHNNFVIIADGSAKQWIAASDLNFTWYSTTVVESQALNKSSFILRPVELPDYFDSVLLKKGDFVTKLSDFVSINSNTSFNQPISSCYVEDYYSNSPSPAYMNIIRYLESKNKNDHELPVDRKRLASNYAKMFAISIIYFLHKFKLVNLHGKSLGENNTIVDQWLLEMSNQFYTIEEYTALDNDIRTRIDRAK